MSVFTAPIDIANRACGRLGLGGAKRISVFNTVANGGDDTKQCSEMFFVYDKLRVAELRRNVWMFSIRKAVLRPLGTTSMRVTFSAWASGTSYNFGAVVTYNGVIYYSLVASNMGNTPGTDYVNWAQYFGPVVALPWASGSSQGGPVEWSSTTNYALGDQAIGSDGYLYASAVNGNLNNNPTTDGGVHWTKIGLAPTPNPYYSGELVYDTSNNVYLSLIDNNIDQPPSSNWYTLTGATLTEIQFLYPVGSGPATQSSSRNVYMLPNGYLRTAPQDPKAGATSFLGAPTGRMYDDWTYENGVFTTRTSEPVIFRFAADVSAVPQFDPMFCEGLAARMALETCETITQSGEKLGEIGQIYKQFMGEARTVNGIEEGPTEPPEDDWITCRI
jgi:hypothetical protein